jgi:hypothetical protein
VLQKVVTPDGWVQWDALKNNDGGVRDSLFRYVGLVGVVSPDSRPDLFPTDNDKLAYYINAYNAICMYAVVKRGYPGNVLLSGGLPGSIFLVDKFPVGGQSMSLDSLEKKKVRSVGDPRVHFALNCCSRSCPKLRGEPYEGAKLDQQLSDAGRKFLGGDPYGAVRDGDKVKLSEIFKFYTDDFMSGFERKTGHKASGLIEAIQPYAPPGSPVIGAKSYSYMSYDWSRNTPI